MKGGRQVSRQGWQCAPFAPNRFLLQRVCQYRGPALGAPLSLRSRSPVSPLVAALMPSGVGLRCRHQGIPLPRREKVVSCQPSVLYGQGAAERRGDTRPSKQGHPEACSALLLLGENIWGAGNASPPCQQLTNSHLRHYQAVRSQALRLK